MSKNNVCVGIVDDEVALVRTYELLFKHKNIPLSFVALDGKEALEKFQNSNPRPGVMIIDYRLPYANGIEVMCEILKLEPGMKMILISADGDIGPESLKSGARVFLKKPVKTKVLLDTIYSLMAS
jgi:FixJ family two-component response regulator